MMKVYESLDLKNNRVVNIRPALASGDWPSGTAQAGALKYTANGLYMYYTPSGESTETWYRIGAYSGTQPTPNNGQFQIDSTNSIGSASSSSDAISFTVNNNLDSGDTVLFNMDSGNLRIANGTTSDDKYISLDVASSIAGEMVFYSTFNSESNTNLYVTITNPLKSSNVVVSVYEQFTYKPTGGSGDRTGWEKIGCEVQIKHPQDNCDILLTLTNVSTDKQFKVVVVGAKSTITGSGTNAVEDIVSATNQSDNGNTTKSSTSPITRGV